MCLRNNDKLWFSQCLANATLIEKLKKIKLIIADIDGSLTDGNMDYTEEKEFSRRFSIVDGFGMVEAQKAGLIIALVSGKKHHSAHVRAQKLKIPDNLCFDGYENKTDSITLLQKRYELTAQETLVFGDDYFDALVKINLPELFFACPISAPFYFHSMADLVIPKHAGNHVFRLLLDLILYSQNKHVAQKLINASLAMQAA